jgi:hypothetical protein
MNRPSSTRLSDEAERISLHNRPAAPASAKGPKCGSFCGCRMRRREIVILSMKKWFPEETLNGLREAEAFRRMQVRMHFRA